jgi:hypothetical protein
MENTALFDDDVENDAVEPVNSADIALKLYQIRKTAEKVAEVEKQRREADDFYLKRIESLTQRTLWLQKQIETYLTMNNMKTIATHNGTAFFSKQTRRTYPETKVLMDWIMSLPEPERFYRKVLEPDKTALQSYMKESGEVPPGYTEEEYYPLRIRQVT